MATTTAEVRKVIRDRLRACNLPMMDSALMALVVIWEVDMEVIEAVMHEEVVKLSHEHQLYWMGKCECGQELFH